MNENENENEKLLERDSRCLDLAIEESRQGVDRGEGGPFGAVIVKRDTGQLVARAHNMVLQTNDPTAHAEVTCIRLACAKLGRFDLSDCEIYSSCQPCPMCFGAIHWAKLPVCKYSSTKEVAAQAGFSDARIYQAIREEIPADETPDCQMIHLPDPKSDQVFTRHFKLY